MFFEACKHDFLTATQFKLTEKKTMITPADRDSYNLLQAKLFQMYYRKSSWTGYRPINSE